MSKLIVWENYDKMIDYYDLFVLRLSYILLLELYEQIYLMNSFERRFYDDLIRDLIDEKINSKCDWEPLDCFINNRNFCQWLDFSN